MIYFIAPFRNCSQFIRECVDSLIAQQNSEWRLYLLDDCSDGNPLSQLMGIDDFRIIYYRYDTRNTALPNIYDTLSSYNFEEEDIIAFIDGDDKLIGTDVIDRIYSLYEDDTLLTYGQYLIDGIVGHCSAYDRFEFSRLRSIGFRASHLRTFKWKLYKQFLSIPEHLYYYQDCNGSFYTSTYDIAIMTPLMELAGFDRIKYNQVPVYYYRRHPNNEDLTMREIQLNCMKDILKKKPLTQL